MKTYYCTVRFDDEEGIYEYDFIEAENEEIALEQFKKWFLTNYGHYDNCLNGIYEVEES